MSDSHKILADYLAWVAPIRSHDCLDGTGSSMERCGFSAATFGSRSLRHGLPHGRRSTLLFFAQMPNVATEHPNSFATSESVFVLRASDTALRLALRLEVLSFLVGPLTAVLILLIRLRSARHS